MRFSEFGLRKLELGQRVVYTHRAGSVGPGGWRDGRPPHSMSVRRPAVPRRYRAVLDRVAAKRRELDYDSYVGPPPLPEFRWVEVWPENGHGVVVGITHRSEGIRSGVDYVTLDEKERWPLYQVKDNLRGPTILVPPWACVPFPTAPWSVVLGLEGEPLWITLAGSKQSWESWVDRVVRRSREPVGSPA